MLRALMTSMLAVFLLAGCDGDNDSDARIRFVQAASMGSPMSFFVDEQLRATLVYADASPYEQYDEDTHLLRGEVNGAAVFQVQSRFDSDIYYSVVAVPENGGVTPVIFVDDDDAPSPGNFQIRAINASSRVQLADIYILREGVSIAGSPVTFENVAFKQASAYDQLDQNEYIVYATLPDSTTAIATSASVDFDNFEGWTAYLVDDSDSAGVRLLLIQDRDGDSDDIFD